MTSFRAVRLGLDYFASVQGRKDAQELCLLYGRGTFPRTLLDGACVRFREIAHGALEEARLEGDQDALFLHLLELWQMNFTLEIKRQRRKAAQPSKIEEPALITLGGVRLRCTIIQLAKVSNGGGQFLPESPRPQDRA